MGILTNHSTSGYGKTLHLQLLSWRPDYLCFRCGCRGVESSGLICRSSRAGPGGQPEGILHLFSDERMMQYYLPSFTCRRDRSSLLCSYRHEKGMRECWRSLRLKQFLRCAFPTTNDPQNESLKPCKQSVRNEIERQSCAGEELVFGARLPSFL